MTAGKEATFKLQEEFYAGFAGTVHWLRFGHNSTIGNITILALVRVISLDEESTAWKVLRSYILDLRAVIFILPFVNAFYLVAIINK